VQFNAFCESRTLYAERLMWELGANTGDPQGNLGRLQADGYHAARLVVDTGIHFLHKCLNRTGQKAGDKC
jgi:uncharacterized protein (DUF885 family)